MMMMVMMMMMINCFCGMVYRRNAFKKRKEINRLRKEINRLLSKEMPNINFKVTTERTDVLKTSIF